MRFEVGKKYIFTEETFKERPYLKDKIFTLRRINYYLFNGDKLIFEDQNKGELSVRTIHPLLNYMVPYEDEKLKEFIRCLK